MKMEKDNYQTFLRDLSPFVPQERIYTDELRRLAWGTDASFYRLLPRIVIRAAEESEVSDILRIAGRYGLSVTFRAAGTSLSGQSVSDSILVVAGKHWEHYSLSPDREQITLQPGIVGQRVNEILAPYGRRFSPDPASIRSAMVGGIVMNNASGMNCGIHANSDRMLLSARIVLADGTVLDTGDVVSRASFEATHRDFIRGICQLRDEVRANGQLSARIRRKYSIKNVTGLNLLPFLRFDDPFEIIAHLMVGSEGTLAFLSRVTMRTEHDYPCKASAMLYFRTMREACEAVVALRASEDGGETRRVHAAEMLDCKSLASVEDPVYLDYLSELPQGDAPALTALLVETKADTQETLQAYVATIETLLKPFDTYIPVRFTSCPEEYARYWAIRSGIFPSVGGTRRPGTTCLIEDVAFHIEDLPQATAELQRLIASHGYDDACIYGHALEGNYHFILNQSFGTPEEVARYEALMNDVKTLVADRYGGSLKAEHGTGRNMAPFVRDEWGEEAFSVMRAVKKLFDPKGMLNPGVIFNDDPRCFLKHIKPLPLLAGSRPGLSAEADRVLAKIDRCIECGFCEVNCVSCGFTLSSRQRIVLRREMARLRQTGEDPERLALLQKQYRYPGNSTCAGDGLCSMSCPMGINTGSLTHLVRQEELPAGSLGYKAGDFAARHLSGVKAALRPVLSLAYAADCVLGDKVMAPLAKAAHNVLGLPQWNTAMPRPYRMRSETLSRPLPAPAGKVVYFPSCINQTMGLAKSSPVEQPLADKMVSLLHKAGYEVIFPENMDKLCCGTIWESKGMQDIADRKAAELEAALWEASRQGEYPVLCDQSPCLHRMRETIRRMKLYEPAEFIYTFLKDRLTFMPVDRPVAVHITCSMRRMGLADTIVALARLCSTRVLVPEEVGCCGFAGDRGFTRPELNDYALRKLRPQIEEAGVSMGYSNSRTCEIGLTTHAGVPYVSIVYLVDECTISKGGRKDEE